MGKDRTDMVAAAAAAVGVVGEDKAVASTVTLYLLRPWTTGNGTTHPAHSEGAEPLTLDFDHLPEGVTTGAIDYLISTGSAESAAMRAARLKAGR